MRLAYAEALRGRGGRLNRLHLVMRLPKPGWGVLNVTGPVVAWSFAEEMPEVRLPVLVPPCALPPVPACGCLCKTRHSTVVMPAVLLLHGAA